jgi:fibronectin-binding autotransporter adhesin
MSTVNPATSEFVSGPEARPPAKPRARTSSLAMLALAGTALVALGAPTAALAQSVVLSGDYVRVGINDKGTLGTGGTVRPGILYDGTGTGTFDPNHDYLTPGSPMEGFVVKGSSGAGAFTATNNNASLGSVSITGGVLTSYNGAAYLGTTYDQRAVWTGIYGSLFSVTHDYHFNATGQQLFISTTITALTNLTALTFTRFEDPDAVAAPGDSSATNNFRGSGAVPTTDLVYAEALVSKYVIGFYSADPTPHNTGVPGFTANPTGYLAGTFLGNGDYTIGMGFTIGSLLSGASINLNYSYIFGTDIAAALAASGGGGAAAEAPPTNIQADSHYTVADLASGGVNPVFDGGVLTLGSSGLVPVNLTVMAAGGGIDTAGNDLILTGVIAGEGRLSKLGTGVLTLTGANSFNGLTVGAGVLAFGSDASLGAAGSTVTLADGAGLRSLSDLTVGHRIDIGAGVATFDTQANAVTLSGGVTGSGRLSKQGTGVLTLTGANSFNGLTVGAGVLAFGSDASLGAAGSTVTVANGAGLRSLSDLTVAHGIEIGAGVAAFDTQAHAVTLSGDVIGGGTLQKAGSGTLTLAGHNSQSSLDIQGGLVIAGAQAALGAADGRIVLRAGSGFAAADDLTITQAVEIAGPDTRFDTGAHQLVLSGPVTGAACFTKVGSGLLNLLGPGSNAIGACVQEGKLSFNNFFAGAVYVAPGAAVGGGGTIAGPISVRGTLSPGNSPGRLVVAGSVTQMAGSSLALDIDGPTPGVGAGHYDTLALTGAGSVYTAAGTIAPITRGITGAASNSFIPRIGDAYQVVTAEGGVTGAFAQIVQPTMGLAANTRLEVLYTAKSVIIAVTPDQYAALATGSGNAHAVAGAADRLRAAGANSFTDGLVGLNEGQLAGVLHLAAGEIHADGMDAVQQANRAFRAQVSERMDPRAGRDGDVWAAITADVRKLGDDATASRYRIDRTGGIVGADHWLTPSLLIGAAASYDEDKIDAGAMGSGRTFTIQGLAYVGWRSGDYYMNGMAGAGSDVFKTVRSVAMANGRTTAYAKPRGHRVGGDIEAGRAFSRGPATVVLAAGLAADQLTRDAVTEAGDAVTALRFEDVTRNALQGRIGARVQVRTTPAGFQITPYASAFVLQELNGASSRLAATLQGAAFQVAAPSPGVTSVRLAVGVEAAVTQRARMSLGYRYDGARGSEGHAFSLRGAIAW